MTEFACHQVRELLGVYVVGAIEPADRMITDQHLNTCRSCREELAGLAPLPALLRRVPLAEAEQIARAESAGAGSPQSGSPGGMALSADESAAGLQSLLTAVRARRRAGRLRSVFALAAALVIAAGGGATIARELQPARPVTTSVVHSAVGSNAGVTAWVHYQKAAWGTQLRIRVMGIPAGTRCSFWVVGKNGHRWADSGWTIPAGGGAADWYPAVTSVPAGQLASFQITAGKHVLVTVPA
jgi:hypothetical protein